MGSSCHAMLQHHRANMEWKLHTYCQCICLLFSIIILHLHTKHLGIRNLLDSLSHLPRLGPAQADWNDTHMSMRSILLFIISSLLWIWFLVAQSIFIGVLLLIFPSRMSHREFPYEGLSRNRHRNCKMLICPWMCWPYNYKWQVLAWWLDLLLLRLLLCLKQNLLSSQ